MIIMCVNEDYLHKIIIIIIINMIIIIIIMAVCLYPKMLKLSSNVSSTLIILVRMNKNLIH